MQVLTLIATIFIPLTFIVGVYGMNFDDMPELHWRWGYPAVMAIMAAIAGVLAWWFWRKGWLGPKRQGSPGTAQPAAAWDKGASQRQEPRHEPHAEIHAYLGVAAGAFVAAKGW